MSRGSTAEKASAYIVLTTVGDWRTDKRLHAAALFGFVVVLAMQGLNSSPVPHYPAVLQIVLAR